MPHRPSLIVGSYNVHKGIGGDGRRDPGRTMAVIRELGADLVALQEVDRRFGDRRGVFDLEALAEATGLTPLLPGARKGALAHGWHGNLLLTRGAELRDLRTLDLPGFEPRGALVADLRIGGLDLRVIAAHLGLLKTSRRAQAQHLLAEVAGDRPTLMMGDLNEWRAGPGCSLARLKGSAPPPPASFPARRPFLPLDRILALNHAQVDEVLAHTSPLARLASDHLPLRARVRLGA
jgi:endonuclease/exonuclease/phosphatase family metal-dependent hydrolase